MSGIGLSLLLYVIKIHYLTQSRDETEGIESC